MKISCEGCGFFDPEGFSPQRGKCRRHAPSNAYHWATVERKDWCGDFQSKEVTPFRQLAKEGGDAGKQG